MTENITGEVLSVSDIHFAVESCSALHKMVEAAYFCHYVRHWSVDNSGHRQADASVSNCFIFMN